MEGAILTVIWTCVTVFIITCAITVLGLLGKISIAAQYMNKLFYALILEIIAVCVGIFSNTQLYIDGRDKFKVENDKINLVKITHPLQSVLTLKNGEKTVFIRGVVLKSKEEYSLLGYLIDESGSIRQISNFKPDEKDSNIFKGQFDYEGLGKNEVLSITVGLIEGESADILDNQFIVKSKVKVPISIE